MTASTNSAPSIKIGVDTRTRTNGITAFPDVMKDGDVAFSDARFQEILQFYHDEAQRPEHRQACEVVNRLSPEEQQEAANSSYAYWCLSAKLRRSSNGSPPAEWRFGAAVREATRHLEGVESVEQALKLLKGTVKYRAGNQTWQYRCCIQMPDGVSLDDAMADNDGAPSTDANAAKQMELRKSRIHHEMTTVQPFVTRGHDRDLRSIIFAFPRSAPGDEESFIDSIVYNVERALACTEFQSSGRQDKIVAVMDSQGSTSPPMKACKAAVNILQQYYPGRLKNLIILNPPYFLLGIYKMIKPFMEPDTAAKFVIVKGVKQVEVEFAKIIDAAQAMPVMMPHGQLRSKVDVGAFLYQRPFYCLYDDEGKEYNLPVDDEVRGVVTSSPARAILQRHAVRGKTTGTAPHHHHATKSKRATTATTTTTKHHVRSKLVAVRTLAVGELTIIGTGRDDDDLQHRVEMVQA